MILQKEKRIELKDPLGELWIGPVEDNIQRLKAYLDEEKPNCLATVGDYVSHNILEAGIHPDIVIVDHKIMRQSVDPIEFDRRFLNVENPPGTVTAQSQEVIVNAVENCRQLAIIIDGEEDLLVLPLMVYMPDNSVIIYGQPREGMVVIKLNEKRRAWAEKFLSEMHKA